MKFIYTFFFIFSLHYCFAQKSPVKKTLSALRATEAPKIDGLLDDPVWSGAPVGSNFVELRPVPGRTEPKNTRTEVKILYDDNALYIAARMYDNPDSVVHELVPRDQVGNADFIGVIFDTFLDGINGYGFFVTAAGVQFDAKYSLTGNEDPNWNAVWESKVNLDAQGWTAELKIPYSALRFSSKSTQSWGLNFTRKRTGQNQQSFWNPVDPKISGFINQSGLLEGLTQIKAPLRLSFSPYLSSFTSHYPYHSPDTKNWQSVINGGMDVKYGINRSFTLDMTLIPDFGQVQSDYHVLNLTPFEVRFDEKRQFFTEGTELFNKGDLFYSKRIGSIPSYFDYQQLKPGSQLIKNPQEAKILNATKISGRTAKGLGIGVFNAITKRMIAEAEDAQGHRYHFEQQPLTNYNILVLDQSLKNNSSVSLVNTNVLRQGSAYNANVSAALFSLNTESNTYYVDGGLKMSAIGQPSGKPQHGYSYQLDMGRKSGTFVYAYRQELSDRQFDPSDLGFYTNNNFFDQTLNLGYNVYKPGKWYNQLESWASLEYSRRFRPGDYQYFGFFPGFSVQFKNFWSAELNANILAANNDFYEARNGQVYKAPASYRVGLYINPNRAKAYNLGGNITWQRLNLEQGTIYGFYLYQNMRLSDKLALGLDINYQPATNLVNWLTFSQGQTLFSRYDRNTVENSIGAKYSVSNRMGFTLGIRHYWSDRRNKAFYQLKPDGYLSPYTGPLLPNMDRSYNVFNIDLVYTWQFLPGSELSVTYKNAAELNRDYYLSHYSRNFDAVFSGPQTNSLSIKVLYYIDYLSLF